MNLGCFSISLAVNDLAASRKFYEAVGFEVIDGKEEQKWLMLKNGDAQIGLFEGMFEDNLITFNPDDARGVEAAWKEAGYTFAQETKGEEGPTSCVLKDPDGNLILVDQH